MITPWSVQRGRDAVYPWSIIDADGTEVARFNDKSEADSVIRLVNRPDDRNVTLQTNDSDLHTEHNIAVHAHSDGTVRLGIIEVVKSKAKHPLVTTIDVIMNAEQAATLGLK